MPRWSFSPFNGYVKRDPFEAVFFTGEEASDTDYGRTDDLVRETIQNSLDAAAEPGVTPVRVRYTLRGLSGHSQRHAFDLYIRPLVNHLRASGNPLMQQHPDPARLAMPTLVYEDFGTRGLEGDPARRDDPPDDDAAGRQDFYWFWRNIGRSGKSGESLARWGLGKTVLPATSRINTMLGLTVRASDGRRLLMGQAVLKNHKLGGQDWQPEGFYHQADGHAATPLPIEDAAARGAFRQTFNLTRGSEPGLSIVVPYRFEALQASELLRSAVVHFFVPILRGRLIVEVADEAGDVKRVDDQRIDAVADGLTWSGKVTEKKHAPPPFDFVRAALQCREAGELHMLPRADELRVPKWEASLFKDETLAELRHQFKKGELVGVRVPVAIKLRGGERRDTDFDAFLWRNDSFDRAEDHVVREGMTISGVQALRGRRGVLRLLLVERGELSGLLGDTEGPTHTDWNTGESRPDAKYVEWKGRVTFVRQALRKLEDLLTPPPAEVDRDLLADIFYVEDVREPGRAGRGPEEEGESPTVLPPGVEPTKRWYTLSPIEGGFHLRRSQAAAMPEPAVLHVRVAYDIRRGDPLKSWSPFDFDLRKPDAFDFKGKGVEPIAEAGNVIRLTATRDDFRVKVTGFDTRQDLYVRVDEPTPVESPNGEGEGGDPPSGNGDREAS